jgi:hypothetical protein
MDDKEKSVIDKFMDTMTSAVGQAVKVAAMPDTEAQAVAKKTNEQMFLGDAAITPEAVPLQSSRRSAAHLGRNRLST